MRSLVASVLILGAAFSLRADPVPGPVVGIGVGIHAQGKVVVVDQVLPDNAAIRGGVKVGDEILKINGASVAGRSVRDIAGLLRGAAGSHLKLTVHRPGETDLRTFTLKRQIVVMPGSHLPEGP